MKTSLKHFAAAFTLTASLLMNVPAMADESQPAPVEASAPVIAYSLNDYLQVEVLGVLNDQNSGGVRLGAAIRVINTSGNTVRIPDHELRLKSDDGTVYTLPASSGNPHGIPGQSEVDLTYLKQLDRQKDLKVTELLLVDVDYDVYPKKETTLVSVPVSALAWNGSHSGFSDPAALKNWGEAFTIPALKSPLWYIPVSINKSLTNQGSSFLVKLLVKNPSDKTETVPAFGVDGIAKTNAYSGNRVEAGNVSLDPGEEKYIHYAIHTDFNTELNSLNILLSEAFTQTDPAGQSKTSTFGIGKLSISLTGDGSSPADEGYTYGSPIAFDPNNDFVNPDLNVSLVELHVTDDETNAYKTAFAKFKLENKSENPLPVPLLQTELANNLGNSYYGIRQSAAVQSLSPGTGTIVSYAFTLPTSETNSDFTLKVQGTVQSDASSPVYRSTIAALPVTVQSDDDLANVKLYPYTLNFKSWSYSYLLTGFSTYTYKVKLDLDLVRDPQFVLDANFSTLKFELVDGLGRSIGAKSFPLVGPNRLVGGYQDLVFSGISFDQAENNLWIRVSESISTPNGEATRVIALLK